MYADLIMTGNIFTGYSSEPERGAVIIINDTIQTVSGPDDYHKWKGPETKLFQFNEELIIPGFHDFHTHTYAGGLSQNSASLFSARSEDEAAQMTADFAAENPDSQWVLGLGWHHIFWGKKELPTKESLDRLIPDRPVFLFNVEYHGAWVNSKALELTGINRTSKDPEFGRIERDGNGEPTGFLYEDALGLVAEKALYLPDKARDLQFSKLLTMTASLGVTSLNDMMPLPGIQLDDTATYRRFEQNGELTLRIYLEGALNGDLKHAKQLRSDYSSGLIRLSGLKAFLDGVATTYTASVVEPYSDRPEATGITLLPPNLVEDWVVAADRDGFRVRLHACGDGGVRLGLNCYEAAQKANGSRDSRHTIEHIETLHPDDFPRFKELDVIASIQPEHLAMTETYSETPYLERFKGDRLKNMFINNSFIQSGVHVAYSSDFPIVEMNPMNGIHRAVTRLHNDGEPKGGWNPEEKVSIGDALKCYTSGGAFGVFRENEIGKLGPGMKADIAVLKKNLFKLDCPEEIRDVKIRMTIFNGKIIYEN
ncbi:MAG: amidohydrolase [Spirochaetales bacterium]|nr:amidohydrolase [Spirochaetales bacterium]